MTAHGLFERIFLRYAVVPALCYGVLVVVLLTSAVFAILDITDRHRMIMASREILARFERAAASSSAGNAHVVGAVPGGSPFLEGETETIASAALLQRVSSAITRVGGNVVSSEVEPKDKALGEGIVRITATSELEQNSLQPLLYDLEAGMPFLFVNKFVVQAAASRADSGRMRVVLELSGQWLGLKSK
jgi:general secretion pathway protein M